MRVLVVTSMWPTPQRLSWGTFVRTQVRSLERAGVVVDLCLIGGGGAEGGGAGGRSAGGVGMTAYAAAARRLRRAAAGADVVHAHYAYPGVISLAQRAAPVVVTFHGDDALGTVRADGTTTAASRRLVVPLSRRLARAAAEVIVQTEAMAAALRRPDAHVIGCEVDPTRFHPMDRAEARAALGLAPDGRYLLFAANPAIPVKNYPLAATVAAEVRRRFPDARLLTVHDAPQDRLARYLNAADVLVFPSFQEGSPNIVKQALACHLPVVASDVGDVRAVVGGAPWCHVGPRDVAAFRDAVCDVLAAGRRTTPGPGLAPFTPERVAARLIEVYRSALARRTSARQSARPAPARLRHTRTAGSQPARARAGTAAR